MKHIFYLILICFTLFTNLACKKAKATQEQQQVDLIVAAMTNGVWTMSYFKENNVENPILATYNFKFYNNFIVEATKNGITHSGMWGADQNTMTTTANFPNGSGPELTKINGNWNIVRSSWVMVEAKQIVNGIEYYMRLDKL
jgi:hypothetical protein